MDKLVIRKAQIRVALHPTAVQATALVAIVPRVVVLVEVDAVVQAAEHRVRFIEAEGAIVRTAIAGVIAITELITVAQCGCVNTQSVKLGNICGKIKGNLLTGYGQ